MPLTYSVVELLNPQKPEDPPRFYARSQTRQTVGMDQLIRETSRGRTITDVELYSVLRTFINSIREHLANGNCVHLENLGKFRYIISSDGAVLKKSCDESYIRKIKLQFRPDKYMQPKVVNMTFEKVLPVGIRNEATEKYMNTTKGSNP